jgi:hypothetical protein
MEEMLVNENGNGWKRKRISKRIVKMRRMNPQARFWIQRFYLELINTKDNLI